MKKFLNCGGLSLPARLGRVFAKPMGSSRTAGLSLIEIIIVIALIGAVMSIIITNVNTQRQEALRDTARLGMGQLFSSLQMYKVHHNTYPSSQQGLNALVTNPEGSRRWRGPYTEASKLRDPWDQDYVYELNNGEPKITSPGPDLTLGTSDDVVYPDTDVE